MTRATWLERRSFGIGASDVPALLIAMGLRDGSDAPRYLTDRARHVVVAGDMSAQQTAPRLFAEKAGLVQPLKVGNAALAGIRREAELIATWRDLLSRSVYYGEHERSLIPRTVRRAEPVQIMPLVDRRCPVLCATPDAWAEDVIEQFVVVQAKCSYGEKRELPWWWRDQVLAEMAVTGADWGVLVCGEYWARDGAPPGDGPIRSWAIERDEVAISEIRDAARRGWAAVEALKAMEQAA